MNDDGTVTNLTFVSNCVSQTIFQLHRMFPESIQKLDSLTRKRKAIISFSSN